MVYRKFAATLVVLAASMGFGHTQEIESVYTKLPTDAPCITIDQHEIGATISCPGYAGYGVLIEDSDARESAFFGHLGEWYLEGAWESFQGFNHAGETIEWRLFDKVPRATILRWFVWTGDDTPDSQILVVSKVGQPGVGEACVLGYVDALANQEANVIARQIADDLWNNFQCRIDEPEFHGETDLMTAQPTRSFGP